MEETPAEFRTPKSMVPYRKGPLRLRRGFAYVDSRTDSPPTRTLYVVTFRVIERGNGQTTLIFSETPDQRVEDGDPLAWPSSTRWSGLAEKMSDAVHVWMGLPIPAFDHMAGYNVQCA